MAINPLSSASGAVGDLGLSSAAKDEANDIAEKMRKKKLMDNQSMASAGVGAVNPVGAAQSLLGGY